jgi:hypothetical protein
VVVSGRARIDDPQAQSARTSREHRLENSVDEKEISLFAVHPIHGTVRLRFAIGECKILDEEDVLLGRAQLRDRVDQSIDHDRTGEPAEELSCCVTVQVRVVPVRTCGADWQDELVKGRLHRFDHPKSVVHVGGYVKAVEMEVAGLVQPVGQPELHAISFTYAQQRAREASVVG